MRLFSFMLTVCKLPVLCKSKSGTSAAKAQAHRPTTRHHVGPVNAGQPRNPLHITLAGVRHVFHC